MEVNFTVYTHTKFPDEKSSNWEGLGSWADKQMSASRIFTEHTAVKYN